jgi:hypothetical protein
MHGTEEANTLDLSSGEPGTMFRKRPTVFTGAYLPSGVRGEHSAPCTGTSCVLVLGRVIPPQVATLKL